VGFNLLGDALWQPLFGHFGEKRRIEHKSHNDAIAEDHKRENEVKFLDAHKSLFGIHSQLVTGRSSNSVKNDCGTGFDVCFFPSGIC
jgi:methylglyoxal synthase